MKHPRARTQELFQAPVDVAPAPGPGAAGVKGRGGAGDGVAGGLDGGAGGGVGMRLNMNPHVIVTGIAAEDSEIFKSNMLPLSISFLTHVPQARAHARPPSSHLSTRPPGT